MSWRVTIGIVVILACAATASTLLGVGTWEWWSKKAPVAEMEPVAAETLPAEQPPIMLTDEPATPQLKLNTPQEGKPNFAWEVAMCMSRWSPRCDATTSSLAGVAAGTGVLQLCVSWGSGQHCIDMEATP